MTTKIIQVNEQYVVRGETIEVLVDQRVDSRTNAPVFDERLDEAAIQVAFAEYRRRHEVLAPQDIVALRRGLGLSQRGFAALLGWSPTTVATYETGALPSEANNRVLRALQTDDAFAVTLYRSAQDQMSPSDRLAFAKRCGLDTAGNRERRARLQVDRAITELFAETNYTVYAGNVGFSLKKFLNVALYFINAQPGMTRTKLNKLMFYTDFKHYATTTVAVTGVPYARLDYGPVPDDFMLLYGLMETQGLVATALAHNGKYEWEYFKPRQTFDPTVFAASELAVMAQVAEHFRDYTAAQISAASHQEPAWQDTPSAARISFDTALELVAL